MVDLTMEPRSRQLAFIRFHVSKSLASIHPTKQLIQDNPTPGAEFPGCLEPELFGAEPSRSFKHDGVGANSDTRSSQGATLYSQWATLDANWATLEKNDEFLWDNAITRKSR